MIISPYTYDPKDFPGEEPYGKNLLETDGYMDTKSLVEEMLRAGEVVRNYREQYDYYGEDGEDLDDYDDPTRAPGFDPLADGDELIRQSRYSVESIMARHEQRLAAQKAKEEEVKNGETITQKAGTESLKANSQGG